MALGWVFAVEGGARVRVHWDGWGVMQGGGNESGWVGIGESLTVVSPAALKLQLTLKEKGVHPVVSVSNIQIGRASCRERVSPYV